MSQEGRTWSAHLQLILMLILMLAGRSMGDDHAVIYLVDRSKSYNDLVPPDQTQALLLHHCDLLSLSGSQTKIGVIYFGVANDVAIVGDAEGMPTNATGAVKHRLLKEFPEALGATPMDVAFEQATKLISKLPKETKVTVVMLSDGSPGSGRLRPDAFREVADELNKRREAEVKKLQAKGFPPKIRERVLANFDLVYSDLANQEARQLYEQVQLKAEFKKVLECAEAMAQAKVRFVTVDFSNGALPELFDIHGKAAGLPEDFVKTPADEVIGRLFELGLTKLPEVVRQDVVSHPADAKEFSKEFAIDLDPLATESVVTWQFQPAIPDFAKTLKMALRLGTRDVEINPNNNDDQVTLAVDGKGNLATVAVKLNEGLKLSRVALQLTSPNQSRSMPAVKCYSHFRLPTGLRGDIRPVHLDQSSNLPATVAPTQSLVWKCGLLTDATSQYRPVKSLDAAFRNRKTGASIKLLLKQDASTPGAFVSEPMQLPLGEYEAVLSFVAATGAAFQYEIRSAVISVLKSERASLQVGYSSDGEHDTRIPNQLAFGELGDEVAGRTIEFVIRTIELDYPINVEPSVVLTDVNGHLIQNWFTSDRKRVELPPGKPVKFRLQVRLPETFESAIEDGAFEGQFVLTRTDTQQPLELQAFESVIGTDPDAPVSRVSFTLNRPQLEFASPWSLRNWIKDKGEGQLDLPVRVTIGLPLQRQVKLEIVNHSVIPRKLTVMPAGRVTDATGSSVPGLMLLPQDSGASSRDVPSEKSETWVFEFSAEANVPATGAFTAFDITGEGIQPQRITVRIQGRDPLLLNHLRWGLIAVGVVCGFWMIVAGARRVRAARFASDRSLVLTPQAAIPQLLEIEPARNGGLRVIPLNDATCTMPGEKRPRRYRTRQSIELPPEVSPERPVIIEISTDDPDEPNVIQVNEVVAEDDLCELHAEVVTNAGADRAVSRARRAQWLHSTAVVGSVLSLLTLHRPLAITAWQWLFDLVFPAF